ncbi:hypothetical protein Tco_1437377 [Tanacetum coccineum]
MTLQIRRSVCGYVLESDSEEEPEDDPADYPADRDDDDDDEDEDEDEEASEEPQSGRSVPTSEGLSGREAWGYPWLARGLGRFRCYVIMYYGSGAECIDFRVTVSRSQETEGDFRVVGIRQQEIGSVN